MRIRCKNCYRVLNNDEEWCTRCGAHSDEVEELMKKGIQPIDELAICKTSIIFYLLIAFLVNGVLNVIFGVIFNAIHTGYNYGEVGTQLPLAITYFSAINALLITSIVMAIVAFFINIKELKRFIEIKNWKKFAISSAACLLVFTGLLFAAKYSNFTILPIYLKDFLKSPTEDMLLSGSMNLFKVIIVLFFYGIAEEFIFRKGFIGGLDEATLIADWQIIVIQAIVSSILSALCFLILAKTTAINYLLSILASLVFNAIMGINYFLNERTITSNLILRVILIILAIIIL